MNSRINADALRRAALLGAMTLAALGCSTPPSVIPLLQVSTRIVEEEADRLDAERGRVAARFDRRGAELAEAFDRDLRERTELDAAWVREAVRVYVAARRALDERAAAAARSYAIRSENLRAAGEAQQRAVVLLEHHRAALPWPRGVDAWALRDRLAAAAGVQPDSTSSYFTETPFTGDDR